MTDIRRFIYSILFVLISTGALLAQPVGNIEKLTPNQVKNFAKNALRVGDVYSAIDFYERYCELKPDKVGAKYELAELYRATRDYTKARDAYIDVYKKDAVNYPKALYYHAIMMKMTGEYEQSREHLKNFMKTYKGVDARDLKKIVKNDIDGCKMANSLISDTLKIIVNHLDSSVNKAHIELSPVSVDNNTFIYGSLVADSIEYFNPEDTSVAMPVRKFYVAKRDGDNWTGGELLEGPFNEKGINVGNGAFSIDGNRFYFTKTFKNWQNRIISKIYVSNKINDRWQTPEELPLPVNDEIYTTTQPTVGIEAKKKEEVLYFVSDRPKGKGGLDIWYTVYNSKKQTYSTPKNCGSKINSVGDEITPYFDYETNKMYFSSTYFPGLGGYDIFKSTGQLTKWSSPKNMGFPLNSSADDIYYTVSKDKKEGFFTSNREGGMALKNPTCCDDIYSYEWIEFINIALKGFAYEMVSTKIDTLVFATSVVYKDLLTDTLIADSLKNITDSLSAAQVAVKLPSKDSLKEVKVEGAVLSLYLIDEESEEPLFVKNVLSDSEGNYLLDLEQGNDYKVVAEKDGYFSDQAVLSTKNIFKVDTLLENFELKMIPLEPIVLNNIYYEFDKANLTEEAKLSIDTTLFILLKENPELIVELSSHTDSRGDDNYNMTLSQRRAESVVKYLTGKGVKEDRLVAKGYGETKPVAPNNNPDGTDNPEGRQMNRRTEFKVIGSSNLYSRLNVKRPMTIKKASVEQEDETVKESVEEPEGVDVKEEVENED